MYVGMCMDAGLGVNICVQYNSFWEPENRGLSTAPQDRSRARPVVFGEVLGAARAMWMFV